MTDLHGQLEEAVKALQGKVELKDQEIEVLQMELLAKNKIAALHEAVTAQMALQLPLPQVSSPTTLTCPWCDWPNMHLQPSELSGVTYQLLRRRLCCIQRRLCCIQRTHSFHPVSYGGNAWVQHLVTTCSFNLMVDKWQCIADHKCTCCSTSSVCLH